MLDFGIAKATGPRFGGTETRTGVTMGTPYYMSPEQVEGKKELDHRSDLWSLAVIACECVTGARPFDGETFGELLLNICARPIVPPSRQGFYLAGFDEWFAKGTNRDPLLRFGSAQELAASLSDVVSGRAKPVPLSAPQANGPDATLPMDPPTLLFTGSQLAQAVTARGTTGAVAVRAHPGTLPAKKRSALLPVVIAVCVALVLGLGALALLLRGKPEASSAAQQLATAEPGATTITPSATAAPLILTPDLPAAPSPGALGTKPALRPTDKPAPANPRGPGAGPEPRRVRQPDAGRGASRGRLSAAGERSARDALLQRSVHGTNPSRWRGPCQ